MRYTLFNVGLEDINQDDLINKVKTLFLDEYDALTESEINVTVSSGSIDILVQIGTYTNVSNRLTGDWSKYVKQCIYNKSKQELYILTNNSLVKLDTYSFFVLFSLSLYEGVDFVYTDDDIFYIACTSKVIVLDSNGTVLSEYSDENLTNIQGITYSDTENEKFLALISDTTLFVLSASISTIENVSSLTSTDLTGAHRICCNMSHVDKKAYVICRSTHSLVQIDLEDKAVPVIESVFSSESMKDPRGLVFIESKNNLLVTCYISQSICVFDTSHSTPELIRVISLIHKPCDVTYMKIILNAIFIFVVIQMVLIL